MGWSREMSWTPAALLIHLREQLELDFSPNASLVIFPMYSCHIYAAWIIAKSILLCCESQCTRPHISRLWDEKKKMSANFVFFLFFQLVKINANSVAECFLPMKWYQTHPIHFPCFSIQIHAKDVFPFLRHWGPNQLPNQVKTAHLWWMKGRAAFSGDFYKLIKSEHH